MGTGVVSVELADQAGLPVLSVRELVVRPVSAEQLSAAVARPGGGGLFQVVWSPVSMEHHAIGDGVVLWELGTQDGAGVHVHDSEHGFYILNGQGRFSIGTEERPGSCFVSESADRRFV